MNFSGFKKEGLDFLIENRLRDSRTWYHENKKIYYDCLVNPMKKLILDLVPIMEKIDPEIICRPDKGISRIARDLRFSSDKHCYRDSIWITLIRDTPRWEFPGYFFEITPVSFRIGMGMGWCSTSTMEKFRKAMINRQEDFLSAVESLGKRTGIQPIPNAYKKDHYPFLESPLKDWCNLREMNILKTSTDLDRLESSELVHDIEKAFIRMKPMYEFLIEVVESVS